MCPCPGMGEDLIQRMATCPWMVAAGTCLLLASPGSLDEQTHTGSLFWLVTRSCDPSEANMEQECAQFEATIKCSFTGSPALKKRKVDPVEWSRQEMPGIPFLFNSKPIAARTKLVMHLPSKKK